MLIWGIASLLALLSRLTYCWFPPLYVAEPSRAFTWWPMGISYLLGAAEIIAAAALLYRTQWARHFAFAVLLLVALHNLTTNISYLVTTPQAVRASRAVLADPHTQAVIQQLQTQHTPKAALLKELARLTKISPEPSYLIASAITGMCSFLLYLPLLGVMAVILLPAPPGRGQWLARVTSPVLAFFRRRLPAVLPPAIGFLAWYFIMRGGTMMLPEINALASSFFPSALSQVLSDDQTAMLLHVLYFTGIRLIWAVPVLLCGIVLLRRVSWARRGAVAVLATMSVLQVITFIVIIIHTFSHHLRPAFNLLHHVSPVEDVTATVASPLYLYTSLAIDLIAYTLMVLMYLAMIRALRSEDARAAFPEAAAPRQGDGIAAPTSADGNTPGA